MNIVHTTCMVISYSSRKTLRSFTQVKVLIKQFEDMLSINPSFVTSDPLCGIEPIPLKALEVKCAEKRPLSVL